MVGVTNNIVWPTVSIIVRTFKRAALLRRALGSVLTQSFRDFEAIVVHDGPADDDTLAVFAEYEAKFLDAGIEFLAMATDEASKYYCVPSNAAISKAAGDYIAFLDDDNEFLPRHLEVLVAAMEEGTVWPDFAYSRWQYEFEPGSRRINNHRTLPHGPTSLQPWDEAAVQRLAAGPMNNFIDSSSFLIAKGALWRLQLVAGRIWNEELRRFADWWLITEGAHFVGWRGKAVDEVTMIYKWGTLNQIQLNRPPNEGVKGVAI